jgi:hypothetical protein
MEPVMTGAPDSITLSFSVISLSLALEETLKALAEKNGKQPGAWLDEVEELALLRARARLDVTTQGEAASAAVGAVQVIFARLRTGLSGPG